MFIVFCLTGAVADGCVLIVCEGVLTVLAVFTGLVVCTLVVFGARLPDLVGLLMLVLLGEAASFIVLLTPFVPAERTPPVLATGRVPADLPVDAALLLEVALVCSSAYLLVAFVLLLKDALGFCLS